MTPGVDSIRRRLDSQAPPSTVDRNFFELQLVQRANDTPMTAQSSIIWRDAEDDWRDAEDKVADLTSQLSCCQDELKAAHCKMKAMALELKTALKEPGSLNRELQRKGASKLDPNPHRTSAPIRQHRFFLHRSLCAHCIHHTHRPNPTE